MFSCLLLCIFEKFQGKMLEYYLVRKEHVLVTLNNEK